MKPVTPLVILAVVATLFAAACGPASGPLGSVPSVQPTPDASASQGDPDLTPEPSLQPSPPETTEPTPKSSRVDTKIPSDVSMSESQSSDSSVM